MYLIALVYNYEYEELENRDPLMAQLIVGAYLLLVSCIAINLFIALLSEAFARVQVLYYKHIGFAKQVQLET